MWAFCAHSFFREYGWQFLRQVAVLHSVKTARAVLGSGALDFSGNMTVMPAEAPDQGFEDARSIVGVGYCLKPTSPPCMSGRATHDCRYLEHLLHSEAPNVPPCCRQCAIREIGTMALKAGAAFYIITSAEDILFDVITPAISEGRFSLGLLVLCRYSLRPAAVCLMASDIRGWLFPFETGDCRDYKSWLLADRGIKEERTEISEPNQRTIRELLARAAKEPTSNTQFERQGNVLYPGHPHS